MRKLAILALAMALSAAFVFWARAAAGKVALKFRSETFPLER